MKEKLTAFVKFCIRLNKKRKLKILKKELASAQRGIKQMEMMASMTGVDMSDYASNIKEQVSVITPKAEAKIKELEAELAELA